MINQDTENEVRVTHAEIAQAALEILRDHEPSERPIYLSRMGALLSAHFGSSIRTSLGSERLGAILDRQLGNSVRFEGQGATLAIRINDKSAFVPSKPIRFDPAVWAAFSKPILSGTRRYLGLQRPYGFNDRDEGGIGEGIEIEPGRIPDPLMPKLERDAHIAAQIEDWCAKNDLSPSTLMMSPLERRDQGAAARTSENPGCRSLLMLIESIAPSERAKFSLPLDMLYSLLKH